jgi:hypothetical protein
MASIGTPDLVTGMRSRTDLTSNRENIDFETGIALLDPNENPFTLATMEMGKEEVGTGDFHWFEDELFPETDVTATAEVAAGNTGFTATYGARFALGDLVMHNSTREVMLVTAVSSDTITVTRSLGHTDSAATGFSAAVAGIISIGDRLTILGNAFMQGYPLPVIKSTKEIDYVNFLQDIRTPMGISEMSEASNHRGENDWALQERKGGISHSRKIENVSWWGMPYQGGKSYNTTTNTTPATTGGINYFITTFTPSAQKLDETDLTEDEFQEFMEDVFEYGPGTKVCYCPPALRTFLDKIGITKLNTFSSDTMYGMAVGRWLSSHGEVIFVTHKMFKNPDAAVYNYAFFLDFSELKWKTMQKIGSTRLRQLRPYEATGETGKKQEFQTIGGMKFGKMANHARLRWKTYSF